MPITHEHLTYFKDLIEGRAALGWSAWWRLHESELGDLPRMEFLKLKFENLSCAAAILTRENINFSWSARGRQEIQFANFHSDVCGPDGRPSKEFLRGQLKGAVGALEDGDSSGPEKLDKELKRLRRIRDSIKLGDELAELMKFGSILANLGLLRAGTEILKAVARWDSEKWERDLLDPAIIAARADLAALGIPTA